MIIPTRKSIRLKRGFTYDDYIIRRNADTASYNEICCELNLTIAEAKAIYDKVFNLPLEAIGTFRRKRAAV